MPEVRDRASSVFPDFPSSAGGFTDDFIRTYLKIKMSYHNA